MKTWDRLKLALRLAGGNLKQADSTPGGLLAGFISGKGGSFPTRNTSDLLNSFNISPWVRACAGKVADSMASIQWRLYIVRDPKTRAVFRNRKIAHIQRAIGVNSREKLLRKELHSHGNEVEEITSHLFLDVLNQPNSEMTGLEMRWLTTIWQDLVGDAFFIKERGPMNAPVGLWPIPPHWVSETPTKSRPFFRIAWRSWQQLIPESEVLWLRHRNPLNPYERGSGITRAIDDEIAIDEFAAQHTKAFFRNQGRPDLLIMPKEGGQLGEAERDRLQNWWTDQLQGFWRRFKPLFLTRPLDVKVIDQNFKDMQMVDLRKAQSDTIMQVWGISPEILGRIQDSNRASVTKAMEIYATHVLTPRLERLRESFQAFINLEYDSRLILTYDSPIPSDTVFMLDVFKAQPKAFALNEWRDLGGLNPVEEFDGVYGSGNTPAIGENPDGTEDNPNDDDDKDKDKKIISLENLSDVELKQLHSLVQKTNPTQEVITHEQR